MDKKQLQDTLQNRIADFLEVILREKRQIAKSTADIEASIQQIFLLNEEANRYGVEVYLPEQVPIVHRVSTLREKIQIVLANAPKYPNEIIGTLTTMYPGKIKKQSIYVMLSRMKEDREVKQDHDGRYYVGEVKKPPVTGIFGGSQDPNNNFI